MKYVAVILFVLFFLLIIANTGVIAYRGLKTLFKGLRPIPFGVIFGMFITVTLLLFASGRMPNTFVPVWIIRSSHYALGFLVYFGLFLNITALILFAAKLLRLLPSPLPASAVLVATAVCSFLVISSSLYGFINAAQIKTVKYTVDLDGDISDFKIALISDLHIGHIVDDDYLENAVDKINEMNVDIVCIAGDIFDGDITAVSDKEKIKNVFRSIKAPIYACLGNHDAGSGFDEMLRLLDDCGINLLKDEYTVIEDRVLLVGRRDSSPIGYHGNDEREAVEIPANNTLPVIVLDHQPSNIKEYGGEVDLILCGHTHAGQLFPGNLIVGCMFDASYGYYREDSSSAHVITTSGVGTWGAASSLRNK